MPKNLVIRQITAVEFCHVLSNEKTSRGQVYRTPKAAALAWSHRAAWNVAYNRKLANNRISFDMTQSKVKRYKKILYRRSLPIFKAMFEGYK